MELEQGKDLKPRLYQFPTILFSYLEKFRFIRGSLDEEADPSELRDLFLAAKEGSHDLLKALNRAKIVLEGLNCNNSHVSRMRIIKHLFNDWPLRIILVNGIETNELILPEPKLSPASEKHFHLEVERQPDPNDSRSQLIIVEYPSPEYKRQLFRLAAPVLDVEEKRRESLVKMIRYCDCDGLRESLTFVINTLREQHEIAEQLVENVQPLIQSIYWQVEVVASNRGERTVLLSPYAVLITKGSHDLPYLPLTALEEQEGTKPKEKKDDSQKGELDENSFARNIVLEPQKVKQIRFLADIPDNEAMNYSKLGVAYSARILDCSIIVKREDVRNWRGDLIILRSSWIAFGGKIAEESRKKIVDLAYQTTFWQRITTSFTRVWQ